MLDTAYQGFYSSLRSSTPITKKRKNYFHSFIYFNVVQDVDTKLETKDQNPPGHRTLTGRTYDVKKSTRTSSERAMYNQFTYVVRDKK